MNERVACYEKSGITGFREVLTANNIPSNQIQFWELWVKQYVNYCGIESIRPDDTKNVDLFLVSLKENNRKPWQIEQAQRACNVYLQLLARRNTVSKFETSGATVAITEKKELTRTPDEKVNRVNSPELWDRIIEKTGNVLRVKHYAENTFRHYIYWVKRFSSYCNYKDPASIHVSDVRMYLEYLAVNRNVSASHQNQAFNALLFLFRHVLGLPYEGLGSTIRAKEIKTLPEILSAEELTSLFNALQGSFKLIAQLLYGCGFRLEEGLTLRIKDLDFSRNIIILKQGKGKKDRSLPLPQALLSQLKSHIQNVRYIFDKDMKDETCSGVFLPESLQNKSKQYARDWGWYWLFPARELTLVKEECCHRRYHIHETTFQRALQKAAADAQITKRVKSHMLRHTFSTDLLAAGYDIRQIQDLLGHTDVRTTMIYTHIVRPDAKPIKSPLDFMKESEEKEGEKG